MITRLVALIGSSSLFFSTWGNSIQSALKLYRMQIITKVLHPTISQRSCHIQHSTCTQYVAMYAIFNIQEFQAAFSTQSSLKLLYIEYSVHGYILGAGTVLYMPM